jgi:CHAD domain-containing protein
MAKPRPVKGLDPDRRIRPNARKVLAVRIDEVYSYDGLVADPAKVTELHDLRIACKRLRYLLEIFAIAFDDDLEPFIDGVKGLQDLLGDIHDCDVQLPEVAAFLEELVGEDVASAGALPRDLAKAPNRRTYAGLVALQVHLRARRRALFEQFLELWRDYERKGFAARLAFALSERSQSVVS